MGWNELYRAGRARHGVTSVRMAQRAGIPRATYLGRVQRDGWQRRHPKVWLLPGTVRSGEVDLAAAREEIGPPALGARLTVLSLSGLVRPPRRPELLIPHRRAFRGYDDIALVRTTFTEIANAETRGDRVTVALAIVQAAAVLAQERLLGVMIDARQQRLASVEQVAALTSAMTGIPGRRALLQVIRQLGADGSDSMLESMFRAEARRRGLEPSAEPTLVATGTGPVRLDVTFSGGIAVECQGYAFHATRTDLDRDARRTNAIALLDQWLVLDLTWDRWMHDRDAFFLDLAAAHRQRAA